MLVVSRPSIAKGTADQFCGKAHGSRLRDQKFTRCKCALVRPTGGAVGVINAHHADVVANHPLHCRQIFDMLRGSGGAQDAVQLRGYGVDSVLIQFTISLGLISLGSIGAAISLYQ